MSLKQIRSVSVFFLDSEDEPGDPNIFLYFSFFGEFGQEGQKIETFYQSKADTAPPHAPTVRLPRNRKEGPGARASWVGVESRKRGGG